jgi:hypothetical protein
MWSACSHVTALFFVNGVYYASMLQDGLLRCAPLTHSSEAHLVAPHPYASLSIL